MFTAAATRAEKIAASTSMAAECKMNESWCAKYSFVSIISGLSLLRIKIPLAKLLPAFHIPQATCTSTCNLSSGFPYASI